MENALDHMDQRLAELFRFLISSRVTLLNSLSTLSLWSDQCMYKAKAAGCIASLMQLSLSPILMDIALCPCPQGLPPISPPNWHFYNLAEDCIPHIPSWVSRHDFFTHTVLFTSKYMTVTCTSIHTNQVISFYTMFLWLKSCFLSCLNLSS